MNSRHQQRAQEYFQQHLGASLEELNAPIAINQPSGESLSANGVYTAIREARRADDPSLPLGQWSYELKRADWGKASELVVDALRSKTKDLQLATWLLEARIHLHGFEGLAAGIVLLQQLCDRYWQDLYPQADHGDWEHRLNIIRWANDKLLPPLRLVPITAGGREQGGFTWADWEQARRNEQWRSMKGSKADAITEGASMQDFMAALATTPSDQHQSLCATLEDALSGIAELNRTLDRLCGDEAPSLHGLSDVLEEVQAMIRGELHKRGLVPRAVPSSVPDDMDDERVSAAANDEVAAQSYAPTDRARAYAQLAEAADYLMRLEPHSPTPYLVRRAIEWGNLNTAELYQELFIHHQGQISIFDLLGVQIGALEQEPDAT